MNRYEKLAGIEPEGLFSFQDENKKMEVMFDIVNRIIRMVLMVHVGSSLLAQFFITFMNSLSFFSSPSPFCVCMSC